MANKTFSDWLASLTQAAVSPGDLIPVVQGGVSKRAPAGQANGLATLDPAGKLAQPRRVLDVQLATGTTGNLSFTASEYDLPDPELTFTVPSSGGTLLLFGGVAWNDLSADSRLLLKIIVSTDGGSTWVQADGADEPMAFVGGKYGKLTHATKAHYGFGVTAKVRMRLRNLDSANTVTMTYNNWRHLMGILVDY